MLAFPPFRSLVFLLSACGVLFLGHEARADLDPGANTPYKLRVVLAVAEHRMLTSAFQKQLESDLQAQLQLAFGKLAKVEVVRAHPLLNDVQRLGLQKVLDAHWDEHSDTHTVFVLLDFVDGRYTIEMGQQAGIPGLPGAVLRRRALAAQQYLAATVVRMIHNDFAPVGTVTQVTDKGVRVVLQGGALSDTLKPWIKKGDILAVSRITQEGGQTQALRVEEAILQAIEDPKDGAILCKYFKRYEEDDLTAAPPVVGFRCVKLNGTRGPVQIRLVDSKTGDPLIGLAIHVSADGKFQGDPKGATDRGFFKSTELFNQVAYVQVLSGGRPLAEFPIEIVDDRVVVVHLSPDAKAMAQGQIELRRDRWLRRLYEALAIVNQNFSDLNKLLTPKSLEAALELAKKTRQSLTDDTERLQAERQQLFQAAAKLAQGLDLSEGDQVLKTLAQKQEQLQQCLTNVQKRIQDKTSKETLDLEAKLEQAELLIHQAEFARAIQLYKEVLQARPSEEADKRLKQLEAAWKVKNPAHAQAREFIYTTWPSYTTLPNRDLLGVKADLAKAKEMFERCKSANDFLTPQKLLLVNLQHADALNKRVGELRALTDKDDQQRAELKDLLQLAVDLPALQKEVSAWVTKDKK
jgi:hypothetical protein